MDAVWQFVLARLSEKSTWLQLLQVAVGLGLFTLSAEATQQVASLGVAAVGVIGMVLKVKGAVK